MYEEDKLSSYYQTEFPFFNFIIKLNQFTHFRWDTQVLLHNCKDVGLEVKHRKPSKWLCFVTRVQQKIIV